MEIVVHERTNLNVLNARGDIKAGDIVQGVFAQTGTFRAETGDLIHSYRNNSSAWQRITRGMTSSGWLETSAKQD